MNKKLFFLISTLLLILTINTLAATDSILKIDNGSAASNGRTAINLTALNVTDLANYDINVTYNPSVVIVTNASNNPAFGTEVNNIDNAAKGYVRIASLNTGAGQSGDVWLSTLIFKAIGSVNQISDLNLKIETLVNSSEKNILVTIKNGLFSIISNSTLKIDSGSAAPNGTTTVNLTALNVTDLANYDINVTYNPSVVIVTGANNNPAFGTEVNNIDNAIKGYVRIASLNTGAGLSGDVWLSTLTMNAVGASGQNSNLNLKIETLVDSDENDILVTIKNGLFNITDTTSPSIDYVNPTPNNGSVLMQNWINVSVISNESLNNAVLILNGVEETMSGSGLNWYLNKTGLVDGVYTFSVRGTDNAGNSNITETRNVTIDTTKPVIQFVSPTPNNGSVIANNWINVNVSSNEPLKNITLVWNGVEETMNSMSINKTSLADGVYTFSVKAKDNAGNSNITETRTVTIDTTKPVIQFVLPTPNNGSVTTNNWINVSIKSNEPLTNAVLIWNGSEETMSGSGLNWYLNKTELVNGVYKFRVRGTDNVGNSDTTEIRTVTVDTTALTINIISPENKLYNVSSVKLDVSSNKNVTWLYNLDNTGNLSLGSGMFASKTLIGLSDGDHKVIVYANDSSGRRASAERTFTIDATKPVIQFVLPTPNNGSVIANNWVNVNISSNEPLKNITLVWNGDEIPMNSMSINKTLLADGVYTFSVKAKDNAGNSNITETRTVTIDTTKPIIQFVLPTPNNGNVTTNNWINVSIKSNEPLTNTTLIWNGSEEAMSGTGLNWYLNKTGLVNGVYKFSVKGKDNAGNSNTTETRTVTVGTTALKINIISPENKLYNVTSIPLNVSSGQSVVTMNLTITPESPVVGDEIIIKGTGASPNQVLTPTVTFENITNVTNGKYDYRLYGINIPSDKNKFEVSANNVKDLNVRVKIIIWITMSKDAVGGKATISQSNVPSGNYDIVIDGNAMDGISSVPLTITASTQITADAQGNFEYRASTSGFPEGIFNLNIAGISKQIMLSKNTTVPNVVVSPIDSIVSEILNKEFANIESQEDITWLYNLDNTGNLSLGSGMSASKTLIGLSDGDHKVIVYANDSSGRRASAERTFTIDATKPVIQFVLPTPNNGSVIANNWVNVNVSSNEPLKNITLVWNGIEETMNSMSINKTSLADGVYTFSVKAKDNAGNSNITETRTVTIDTTKPLIQFVLPTPYNGSITANNWINVSIKSNEPLTNAVLIWNGSEDEETMSGSGLNWYLNKTGLANGVYKFRVKAKDNAGNSNTTEIRTVTVDTTALIINIISPEENKQYGVSSVKLDVSSNKDATWLYNLDNTGNVSFGYGMSASKTLIGLSDGDHKVIVYANDSSGRRASAERNFGVDTTIPLPDFTMNIDVPRNIASNQSVPINVTVFNIGTKASSVNFTLNFSKGGVIYDTRTYTTSNIMPKNNTTQTVYYTFTESSWTLVSAKVDAYDEIQESNEFNNNAYSRWVYVGVKDLQVFIYSKDKAISGTTEKATVYVKNVGNLKTEPTNLKINITNATSYNETIYNVPELTSGWTETYIIDVQVNSNVTINAFVVPVNGEEKLTNNNASKTIEGTRLNLSINYIYEPYSKVYGNRSFWTGVRFSSNAWTVVNATIELPDGLKLPTWENKNKTVYAGNGNYNWVGWYVITPDYLGTYYYNMTISAYDANDTKMGRVSTFIPLATLKDFNSTTVDGGENKTMTFASFNVTSFKTDYKLSITGGTEGRILEGLEYLFGYPHGCVEQTSSPTLAGLKIKKYYESVGKWNGMQESKKQEIVNKIIYGLNRLNTMKASSGAFAIWGGETGEDALPTIYAYYTVSRALHDSNSSISNSSIAQNINITASWVIAHQETDGSWESKYYYGSYYEKPILTGMALMDYNLSEPYLNNTVKSNLSASRQKAVAYLLSSQQPNGSWNLSGKNDPYATGFALLGLAYSGNNSTTVTNAINKSVDWLKENQKTSGYWEGTKIYKAWSTSGIRSETTAVAMEALLASGVSKDDSSVVNATKYLIGVYELDKSWGYTKTSQEAIQALLKVMNSTEKIDLFVNVSINGNTSKYHINNTNTTIVNITSNVTCTQSAVCNNTAYVDANGSGLVAVSIGGTQIIRYKDKDLVPKKYVDPIDEDLSLDIEISDGIEKQQTKINLSVTNPTDELIFSPIIEIQLNNTMFSGKVVNNIGTEVATNVSNNTLYIYPEIVGNHTTESYLFNLTFNNSGYKTIEAQFAPMYNPTLLTFGNGTGYIKGYGNLSFEVYDGYGGIINSSINIQGTVVEGSHNVNISKQEYVDIRSIVEVSPNINRSYIVRMFNTIDQPEIVLSEHDARPASIKTSFNASVGITKYDMAVSAEKVGIATAAMTIPENMNLSGVEIDSQALNYEIFNGTAYVTANVSKDSIVTFLFRNSEIITTTCRLDAGGICSVNSSNSTLEIYSSNTSEANINTKISNNASEFNISSLSLNGVSGISYLNITHSNLIFDWAIIKIFYYADELKTKNLSENNLKMYWYNRTNNSWHVLNNGSDYRNEGPYVNEVGKAGAGVGRNYTWANVTHFSIFAIGSTQISTTTGGDTGPTYYGGSGGSSGGGGGVSGENYANVETREKYDKHIYKDESTSYAFTNSNNPIMFVNITGNVNAGEINVAVEVLRNISTLIKSQTKPAGVVAKYMNIWVGTSGFATPQNIKEATIKFRVNNEWLKNNNFEPSDIMLVKWDGSQWIKLETTLKEKDSINTYFEAKTSSFSPFAIIGIKLSSTELEKLTPSPTPQSTETTVKPTEAGATVKPTETEKSGSNIFIAIFGFILIIIAIYAMYVFKQKKMK